MALTGAQKLSVRLALREPLEAQTAINTQLGKLDSDAETKLKSLITEWDSVSIDNIKMKIDGVEIDNQAKAQLIAGRIADLVGWTVNEASVILGRGFIEEYGDSQALETRDSEWDGMG